MREAHGFRAVARSTQTRMNSLSLRKRKTNCRGKRGLSCYSTSQRTRQHYTTVYGRTQSFPHSDEILADTAVRQVFVINRSCVHTASLDDDAEAVAKKHAILQTYRKRKLNTRSEVRLPLLFLFLHTRSSFSIDFLKIEITVIRSFDRCARGARSGNSLFFFFCGSLVVSIPKTRKLVACWKGRKRKRDYKLAQPLKSKARQKRVRATSFERITLIGCHRIQTLHEAFPQVGRLDLVNKIKKILQCPAILGSWCVVVARFIDRRAFPEPCTRIDCASNLDRIVVPSAPT